MKSPQQTGVSQSPELLGEQRGYVICFTERSGSTMLCEYLSATGALGMPREYLHGSGIGGLAFDPKRQLRAVLAQGLTANGVYGLKVSPGQMDNFPLPWPRLLPNLSFVHISRRDLLGQALSAARAEQSQQWRSTMKEMRRSVVYDAALIKHKLTRIVRDEARWQLYFAINEISPLRLVYEEFCSDPLVAVRQVAELVSLREVPSVDRSKITLRMQRDEETEQWRSRFVAENLDTSMLPCQGETLVGVVVARLLGKVKVPIRSSSSLWLSNAVPMMECSRLSARHSGGHVSPVADPTNA
jgi:LPS sulfotransferase NodH